MLYTLLYNVTILLGGFALGMIFVMLTTGSKLEKLQKDKILTTKKGTYTFTPSENKK